MSHKRHSSGAPAESLMPGQPKHLPHRRGYLGLGEGRKRIGRALGHPDETIINKPMVAVDRTFMGMGPDNEAPNNDPSESGTARVTSEHPARLVLDVRGDVGDSLDNSSLPPTTTIAEFLSSVSQLPDMETKEANMEQEVLARMGELLRQNTLAAHQEALRILQESGLMADQRYDGVHTESDPDKRHGFSRPSKRLVNSFAKKWLPDHMDLSEALVILELGSGFGNDAIHLAKGTSAHVIGIDASNAAVTEGKRNVGIRPPEIANRVTLINGNYLEMLKTSQGAGISIVYSHSTLHYMPPLVLREDIFPKIADVLRSNQEGAKWGKLCMAMKLSNSASARSANQMRLVHDDPYTPCVDRIDKLFRIFPRTKKDVLALLEPSFDIEHDRVAQVRGYEREGDTEIFCYVIASPKPLKK